ncbi:MAG: hypothetical protein R2758_12460 [Bacteroidales bacterium]
MVKAATCDTDHELAIVIRDRQDRYLVKVWPVAYRVFLPGKKLQDIIGVAIQGNMVNNNR